MNQKSVLISGASSGIGYTAACILKDRGYQVFATARKASDVARLQEEGFDSVLLDVTDHTSIQHALAFVLDKTGGTLDALFSNAGYLQAGAVADLSEAMLRAQFETNFFGAVALTKEVLAIMQKQGYGRIVQTSSILGIITLPFYGAYNASKFALEGLFHSLRLELRETNIKVSLINPGPIRSELRNHAYQHFQNSIAKISSDSQYQAVYQALERQYFHPSKQETAITLGPEAVTKQLIHALESPKPHAHYYTGFPAKLLALLHRLLPDRVMDWVLSKNNPYQIKEEKV